MQWQRALVFANVDKLMWEDRAVLGDQLKQICLVKFRCPYLWIMKMAFGGKKEKCGRGKINSNNVRVFFMESKKKLLKQQNILHLIEVQLVLIWKLRLWDESVKEQAQHSPHQNLWIGFLSSFLFPLRRCNFSKSGSTTMIVTALSLVSR